MGRTTGLGLPAVTLAGVLTGCSTGVAGDGLGFNPTGTPDPDQTSTGHDLNPVDVDTDGGSTGGVTDGGATSGGLPPDTTSGGTTGDPSGGSTGDPSGGGSTGGASGGGSTSGGSASGGDPLPGCGDGVVQGAEACDDGNLNENDGCTSACTIGPVGLSLSSPADTALRGNVGGGNPFTDACPAGQVLVGFEGTQEPYIRSIRGLCGTPTLTSSLEVSISGANPLPVRGTSSGTPWSRTCPANQAVAGFSGMSGNLVDQLLFRCAPLEIVEVNGSYALQLGAISPLAGAGQAGGSGFPTTDCGAARVGTAVNTRAGDGIDAFGLGCHQVSLTFP